MADNSVGTQRGLAGPETCCVTNISVPHNYQAPEVIQEQIGRLKFLNGTFLARFEMRATFSNDKKSKNCCCKCCEYRQFIKGYALINQYYWYVFSGQSINNIDYLEDVLAAGSEAKDKTERRYGPRENPLGSYDYFDEGPNSTAIVNTAEGCHFIGQDTPGFKRLATSISYVELQLDFVGIFIDVCAMRQAGMKFDSTTRFTLEQLKPFTKQRKTWSVSTREEIIPWIVGPSD